MAGNTISEVAGSESACYVSFFITTEGVLGLLSFLFYFNFIVKVTYNSLTNTYTYNTQWTSLHILDTHSRFNIIMTSAVQDYYCISFQDGWATCYEIWRPSFQVGKSS